MIQDTLKSIDLSDRILLTANAESVFSLLNKEIAWPVVCSKVEALRLDTLKWLDDACKG